MAKPSRRRSPPTKWAESVVGRDDGACPDLAVVQQVVGVRCIPGGGMFDEHLHSVRRGRVRRLFGGRAEVWRGVRMRADVLVTDGAEAFELVIARNRVMLFPEGRVGASELRLASSGSDRGEVGRAQPACSAGCR